MVRSGPDFGTFPTKFVSFANRVEGAGRASHNAQELTIGGEASG
jgi:hypothetical protein